MPLNLMPVQFKLGPASYTCQFNDTSSQPNSTQPHTHPIAYGYSDAHMPAIELLILY